MSIPQTFEASFTDARLNAYYIEEGFGAAAYDSEVSYLCTYGLKICKAIAIHSKSARYGLLAHLPASDDFEASMQSILDVYDEDITKSDVRIVHTQTMTRSEAQWWPDELGYEKWPRNNQLAAFFEKATPASLKFDRNMRGVSERAIALCLMTGEISDVPNRKKVNLPNDGLGEVKSFEIGSLANYPA